MKLSLPPRLLMIGMILIPLAALLMAAGCHTPSPQLATQTSSDLAEFVGNAACAECHQDVFEVHRKTRHANTMRPATVRDLGTQAPPIGPIPHSAYAIREQNGNLRFERIDQPSLGATMRFALGEGKDGMTYIGEFTPESLTEFRMSYLPDRKTWSVTPGQDTLVNLDIGMVHEMGMARRCIECHAMKMLPNSTEPAPGFLGVGCESCHGPGSAHIAAAKAKQYQNLKMDDISQWGAAKINALCARCHRSQDNVTLNGDDATATARFQGYGLSLSPCFQKSGDKLSCITCHDPHTNVSKDHRAYEKVCLSCHSPSASPVQHTCPVNPKDQCITCHMPTRPIFTDKRLPIFMADHLILANHPKR